MVFKEVGRHLGMAANSTAWEALLQNTTWSGIDKNYHNALYATDAIPLVPFVPVPEDDFGTISEVELQSLRNTPSTSMPAISAITWDIGHAVEGRDPTGLWLLPQAHHLHRLHCLSPPTLALAAPPPQDHLGPVTSPQGSEDVRGDCQVTCVMCIIASLVLAVVVLGLEAH
ncbi:hypothetical protein M404DRAFT_29068 [Pisolithus tinctorius Marx 270]|uniref:Uncharacterized protein n=1 Tax=Pisolithus tinctorius Marx 270 TaxID=870435 RepID=A0A0C3IW99_PISTI|nr:hypothetical protein M404DRAFT_29068 [Pisolithus tinctorius Marx 270]